MDRKIKFKKTVQVDVDGKKYDVDIVFWEDRSISTISENKAAAELAYKNIVFPAVDLAAKRVVADFTNAFFSGGLHPAMQRPDGPPIKVSDKLYKMFCG